MDLYKFSKLFKRRYDFLPILSSFLLGAILLSLIQIFLSNIEIVYFKGELDFFEKALDKEIKLVVWLLLSIPIYRLLNYISLETDFAPLWLFASRSTYEIDFAKEPERFKEWRTQGYSNVTDEGLVVSNSNSGLLLDSSWWSTRNKWKNFVATLHIALETKNSLDTTYFFDDSKSIHDINRGRILKEWRKINPPFREILGVVFRAQGFEDYFMLELWKINDEILMKPHVRVNGEWDVPLYNSANYISRLKPLGRRSSKEHLTFRIEVKGPYLVLSGDISEDINWFLPTDYQINLGKHSNKNEDAVVRKIPFRNMAGQFGFRNFGNELAIVKYLKIEPLQ